MVRKVTKSGSKAQGKSMKERPQWMMKGKTAQYWAPHVFEASTNPASSRYVMYFAGTPKGKPKLKCIGAAFSGDPTKVFTPRKTPLICGGKNSTVIDPAHFAEAGKNYLVYKQRTFDSYQIRAIQVTSGWGKTTGKSWKLRDGYGRNIEAPSLVKKNKRVYMFVSVNNYKTCAYRTVYTSSTSIRKAFGKLRMLDLGGSTKGRYCGPGGADVVKDARGKYVIAFHGWKNGKDKAHGGIRQTWTGKLRW